MGHVQLLTTCLILQMGLVACSQNTTTYPPSEKDSLSRRIEPQQQATRVIVNSDQIQPFADDDDLDQVDTSRLSEYLSPTMGASYKPNVQEYRKKLSLKADEVMFFGEYDQSGEHSSVDISRTEFLAKANDLAINHLRALKTPSAISERGEYETTAEYRQRQASALAQHQQNTARAFVDLTRIEDTLNLSGYVWVLKQADSDRFHEMRYDVDHEMLHLRTLSTKTTEDDIERSPFYDFPKTLYSLEIQAHLPRAQAQQQFEQLKDGITLAFILKMDQHKRLSLDRIALLNSYTAPVVIQPEVIKFTDILVEATKTRNEETGYDERAFFYTTQNERLLKLKQPYAFQFGIESYRPPQKIQDRPVQDVSYHNIEELQSRAVEMWPKKGEWQCASV